jgi:hypothetical protein
VTGPTRGLVCPACGVQLPWTQRPDQAARDLDWHYRTAHPGVIRSYPLPAHGRSRYMRGCRCDVCTAANTEYVRHRRHAPIPDTVTHGKASTYTNSSCRCDACTSAHRALMAEQRVARKAKTQAGSPDVPHGTRSGYTHWACRCERCSAAEKAYKLRLRAGAR